MALRYPDPDLRKTTTEISIVDIRTIDFAALDKTATTEGVSISMTTVDEIKKITSKFIMENKTAFDELAKS